MVLYINLDILYVFNIFWGLFIHSDWRLLAQCNMLFIAYHRVPGVTTPNFSEHLEGTRRF